MIKIPRVGMKQVILNKALELELLCFRLSSCHMNCEKDMFIPPHDEIANM